jgi:hypothetical protein
MGAVWLGWRLSHGILPPLTLRNSVAGVYLCIADEAISNLETAEKWERADTTLVPSWILLVEGTR